MRRALALLVLTLLALPALETTALPGDTQWVLQVDVRRLVDGGLGPWLRAQAAAAPHRARLALLKSLAGVDLLTDVDRITLVGPDTREDAALVVVQGRFDRGRLETLAEAAPGHRSEALRSHVLHRMDDTQRGRDTWAALAAGDRVLVFGARRERVVAALDVLDRTAKSLDPAALGALPDAPVVAAAAGLERWIGAAPRTELLRSVRGLTLALREDGDDLVLGGGLAALDESTAGDLARIVDGFLALARLNPETQRDATWAALVRSARVGRDGAALSLSARVPRAEFQRSAEAAMAGRPARPAER